ncbi:MAG: linear amide C-N hydrolase [Candidatus Omnitrophota bacterium]
MYRKVQIVLLIALLILLDANSVNACSYFFLNAKDGSVISARTDEFYSETDSKLELVPRGISFTSTAPQGAVPVSWKTKYGFVAISMFGNMFGEGLNEKGLATGGLWFGDVKYPDIKPGDQVISVKDIIGWVLGNFQTVGEVKEALPKVKMWSDAANELKMILPIHIYITDASGDSIVVEYIDGALKIWDNRANGVMTNEPDLGWHLSNLRFYSNMNPHGLPIPELNDDVWSLGTGLLGMPGDYTNAGRFVRLSLLKYFSTQPKDASSGVILAEHIMNNVDIPYGPQLWIQGQRGFTQWTIWTVIYDHTGKYFYYRTYDNPTLRRFDLSKLPFAEGNERKQIEIFGGNAYEDDTSRWLSP